MQSRRGLKSDNMRIFLIVLGLLILVFGGLVIYSYTMPTPQTDVEEVISDDKFPS
jgi:hypothetical protein